MFKLKKNINGVSLILAALFCQMASAGVDCNIVKGKHKAIITKVSDGDTATVKIQSGKQISVRFYGVDTPESSWPGHWPSQPFSLEAKKFTVKNLKDKSVEVVFTGDGTYSRCVGEIFIDGKSHSLSLIKGGFAWWYSKYSPGRNDFKRAQASARKLNLGLWKNNDAVAPWVFRKKHRS